MNKTLDNSTRAKALAWWRQLDNINQVEVWRKWGNKYNKDWSFNMFANSSSTIEQAWIDQAF